MILCDIHNPTASRRTFYDGISNLKPISIDPGETRVGVKLAEHVVSILKRAIRPDLKITERDPVVKPQRVQPVDIPAVLHADPDEAVTIAPRRGRPPKQPIEG
jgi:hypothetical protein